MKGTNLKESVTSYVKSIPKAVANATLDLLENSDFISRSVGMNNSYEDIMSLIQGLGREPISLLGKDYLFIFDHVRRNYKQGTSVMRGDYNSVGSYDDGNGYGCTKFTFYKERPTVRFANVDSDPLNLLTRWEPSVEFGTNGVGKTLEYYAESNDGETNNKEIDIKFDVDSANPGIDHGRQIVSYANSLATCDMIRKTNDNFNHGKYQTLVARFHTNDLSSKDGNDMTQTAISTEYGMSHGRNLMKRTPTIENGYDNPYCRVWTYHHQYNQLARAIRPFGDEEDTARKLEESMSGGNKASNHEKFVSFRTTEDKKFGFKGGSERLDTYGSLNYSNGLVNIAPTATLVDYFQKKEDKKISVKRCMFSIENLAWKSDNIVHNEYDEYGLSAEQKGPLGGRIMWFPPYGLSFHENVTVNWNKNDFIGRGEGVYTYTNTERSGNISFMLLVDHPSILDYWTGRNVDKPTNNGIPLTKGDANDPTTIDNQENTILRFFAGCDVLTAKPQYWYKKKPKKKEVKDVKEPEPEVAPKPTKKVLHCVLYYPNNYSGADDSPIKSGKVVNAVHYLMNGVGAQKMINSNNDAEDIPTTIDVIPTITKDGSDGESFDYGGYEKGKVGISITKEPLEADYSIIKSTYADLKSKERKGQFLTEGSGKKAYCQYSSKDSKLTLAKYIGSQALSLGAAKVWKNLNGKPHEWYRRRWYYRVDSAYQNDRLSTKESYLDINSYGLNSNLGYKKLLEYGSIASAFGLNSTDENTKLVSFADMFAALEKDANSEIYDGMVDEGNVSLIREIVANSKKYNITSIEFQGHASYQGYAKKNTTLSSNRALTFKKWMQSCGFPKVENAKSSVKRQNTKDNTDKGYNSSIVTKMWRSASVIIEYEESEIASVNSTTSSSENVNKIEIPNGETSFNLLNKSVMVDTSGMSDDDWRKSASDAFNKTMRVKESKGFLENALKKSEEANKARMDRTILDFGTVERYDNEGEFFEMLGKKDPFMHHLICEKIKYFDPAFHSISPEGFNARLNFLHQCTRQGSTVDASNGSAKSTAYNLSFGRPPVCVLRLGDFYYTKIIINSMSIEYDDVQWDLNPEGIGVMPVFAKVNLNFIFLGGSDLAGPISRLQNAVSFNYYANTGVYDNRAEMVQYDSEGNGKEVAFKPYSYPDMLHKSEGLPKGKKGSGNGETPTIAEFKDDTSSPSIGKKYVSGEIIKYQKS